MDQITTLVTWRQSPGAPAWPHVDAAREQRYDAGLEARIAENLPLLYVKSDGCDLVITCGGVGQGAVRRAPRVCRLTVSDPPVTALFERA